jgi:hypothetical protein
VNGVLSSPNRIVALALGAGVAGYGGFALATGRPILGTLFGGAGVVLVVAGLLGITAARRANVGVGTAWLALGYLGLFLVGTEFNLPGLGALGEVGLFAASVVHLAVGLGARRDRDAAPAPADAPAPPLP